MANIDNQAPINAAFYILPLGSVLEPTSFQVYGFSLPFPNVLPEHAKWWPLLESKHSELKVFQPFEVPRGRIYYQGGKYALYMWRYFYDHWDVNRLLKAINEFFNIQIDGHSLYDDPWGDYVIDLDNLAAKLSKI